MLFLITILAIWLENYIAAGYLQSEPASNILSDQLGANGSPTDFSPMYHKLANWRDYATWLARIQACFAEW